MRAIRWHLRVLPIVILMKNTWAHQADAPKRVHAGGAGNEVNLILSQCLWETYIMLQTWSSRHGYCVFGGVKNTAALEYWPTPPQVGFTAGTGPHLIAESLAESRCCRRTGTLISLLDRSTRETEMLFSFWNSADCLAGVLLLLRADWRPWTSPRVLRLGIEDWSEETFKTSFKTFIMYSWSESCSCFRLPVILVIRWLSASFSKKLDFGRKMRAVLGGFWVVSY